MSAMFGMPGVGAPGASAIPQPPKSRFQKFMESPLYTIVVNGTLFVAGVAFIQSPLMEMMAPQL
ncbi:hypothetical protein HG536_0H02840 [Torulaspora globosa]|uniref:Mitochondrial import receptor subunit TOM6 n=1 Tax=Torulaspora globosa TaxID=48254 RepID=A0A7G3ZN23_9SACH|nr:uncharacterized protein HG536_0H02840 [Torulaspora globosa]QLL34909.1 hypothetical protein HG536_0H02840 [Torulaspora globosa]